VRIVASPIDALGPRNPSIERYLAEQGYNPFVEAARWYEPSAGYRRHPA